MTAPKVLSPAQQARMDEINNLGHAMTDLEIAELMFLQFLAGDLEMVDEPSYRLSEQGMRKAQQLIYRPGGLP